MVQNTGGRGQIPRFLQHGAGQVEMGDVQPTPCKQNGKTPVARPSVKDGFNALQMPQNLPFEMRLLNNVVYKELLPVRLLIRLLRQIPKAAGDIGR